LDRPELRALGDTVALGAAAPSAEGNAPGKTPSWFI
jgi:hypothetical protein